MKQNYRIQAVSTEGLACLDMTICCTQYQVQCVCDAFAFAMATDGTWNSLKVSLVQRNGTEHSLYVTYFKAQNG